MRVTRLSNGKSAIVRITDRGITDHRFKIDVCREAAEQLEVVHQGVARVRLEVVPEELKTAGSDAIGTPAH